MPRDKRVRRASPWQMHPIRRLALSSLLAPCGLLALGTTSAVEAQQAREPHGLVLVSDLAGNAALVDLAPGGAAGSIVPLGSPGRIRARSFGLGVGDLDGDGNLDYLVAGSSDANARPDPIELELHRGLDGASFASGETLQGVPPIAFRGIAIADYDEDGALDFAASDSEGLVRVYRGLGGGAFAASTAFVLPFKAAGADAADLDGDGHVDFAVNRFQDPANSPGYELAVFLGDGQGGFTRLAAPLVNPPARHHQSSGLALADFDGDDRVDVAVTNVSYALAGYNYVSVYRGNGDGTFNPAPIVTGAGPARDQSSLAALANDDADGDGQMDLILADGASAAVTVLLGRGDGTFETTPELQLGTSLDTIVRGLATRPIYELDRDHDGVLDRRDVCPEVQDPGQEDSDGDGVGDACTCLGVVCPDLGACHTASACDPATGLCSGAPLPDGTACSDHDACNGLETCGSGECLAGAAPNCDDHNPCTEDRCEPTSGCAALPLPDGEFSGSISTSCGVGACASTGALSCGGGAVVDSCTAGPAAELDASCDGVDDDCNGDVDEDYASVATSCGIGACAAEGHLLCTDGQLTEDCTPGQPADGDGQCDGIDEDCDGQVDEDCGVVQLPLDVTSQILDLGLAYFWSRAEVSGPELARAELLAWLRARPEVASAGVGEDGFSYWFFPVGGRPGVIVPYTTLPDWNEGVDDLAAVSNGAGSGGAAGAPIALASARAPLALGPPCTEEAPSRAPLEELVDIGGRRMLVLDMADDPEELDALRHWASGREQVFAFARALGFEITHKRYPNLHLADFADLSSEGIVMFVGHGSAGSSPAGHSVLATNIPFQEARESTYTWDTSECDLTESTSPDAPNYCDVVEAVYGSPGEEKHIAYITHAFFAHRLAERPMRDAMVVLMACYSNAPSSYFDETFLAGGARVFLGQSSGGEVIRIAPNMRSLFAAMAERGWDATGAFRGIPEHLREQGGLHHDGTPNHGCFRLDSDGSRLAALSEVEVLVAGANLTEGEAVTIDASFPDTGEAFFSSAVSLAAADDGTSATLHVPVATTLHTWRATLAADSRRSAETETTVDAPDTVVSFLLPDVEEDELPEGPCADERGVAFIAPDAVRISDVWRAGSGPLAANPHVDAGGQVIVWIDAVQLGGDVGEYVEVWVSGARAVGAGSVTGALPGISVGVPRTLSDSQFPASSVGFAPEPPISVVRIDESGTGYWFVFELDPAAELSCAGAREASIGGEPGTEYYGPAVVAQTPGRMASAGLFSIHPAPPPEPDPGPGPGGGGDS